MAAIWSEVLGLSRIGIDQSFFDLGGTSLTAIQARALIEKQFGVELPLRAFFETPTVEQLIGQLGSSDSSEEPIVMVLRRGKSGVLPVHCLVGIEIYRDLAQAFEGDWPVVGMHVPLRYVPGRESLPSVPEIAMRYVNAIRRRQPEGPYHLAGLCFGGIVAYEAGRQLEAMGQVVATVAVFDGYLPSAVRIDRAAQLWGYTLRALESPRHLLPLVRERVSRSVERLKGRAVMTGDGKAVDLPLDGDEVEVSAQRYEQVKGVLRTGHLIVFRATARDWPPWFHLAPDLGWGARATRLTVHEIPSDHLELVRPPHVREVAAIMEAALVSDSPREGVASKRF
jgi:thioesterase domain-containing protein/acyl carrier protein